MPSVQQFLNPIEPLHYERYIASSPDGVCPGQIDSIKRDFAEREPSLANQASNPKRRATGFENAAKLMICDRHKDTSREARKIARRWEREAAQNSHRASVASKQLSSYNQSL
ncbi:uncharacterized protein LDX57_007722 [Aspergillus melleus]|uniref:uncharacterized protein n=1 Tax=Aspergillus melleus TaxID=138277 RepID=UPI001E8D9536|nr:uncharacterized protein LDX57_007722 [Aspergillus melleus]KAH8430051.1 hypothetical protein LDX57_007722 [Aspergillus melleus]